MMSNRDIVPGQFYASYPQKVIARPGYPARAAYKSALMFNLYSKRFLAELGTVKTYADIGGCFGFGANAMSYHIQRRQGSRPRTYVFEFTSGFKDIGKLLFPEIEFVDDRFENYSGDIEHFDLVSLFDVVEHIVELGAFLKTLAGRGKYVLLNTPMETSGEWFGSVPPEKQGDQHEDGHVNFFSPKDYEALLKTNGFDIIGARLIPSIVPPGANWVLMPEWTSSAGIKGQFKMLLHPRSMAKQIFRHMPLIPWALKRKLLGGGNHLCLCKSRIAG